MLEFNRQSMGENREYQVLLEEADGSFIATSPALPGYVAYGSSEASAIRKLRRAMRRSMEGFAKDYGTAYRVGNGTTSRYKSYLHFRLPLTTTAKVALSSLAGAALLAALAYQLRRRD